MITLAAVGDLSFNGAYSALEAEARHRIFAEILPQLRADIVMGNLESPLTTGKERVCSWRHSLRAEPHFAKVLQAAGFTAVCLANNHSMDYGWEALSESMKHLEAAGVRHFGAGRNEKEARTPAIIELRGRRIALLGYCDVPVGIPLYATSDSPGVARLVVQDVMADVERARAVADYVIVHCHWGMEYTRYPQPRQRAVAAQILGRGAAALIGHHPHVLQGAERIDGRPVLYSLGNLTFADGQWNGVNPRGEAFTDTFRLPAECRRTGIARIGLAEDGAATVVMVPVRLRPDLTLAPDADRAVADARALRRGLGEPGYRLRWAADLARVRVRTLWRQAIGQRGVWKAIRRLRPRHAKDLLAMIKNEARQFRGVKQA